VNDAPTIHRVSGRTFVIWRDSDGWWHPAEIAGQSSGKLIVSCGYPSVDDVVAVIEEDVRVGVPVGTY
jgi:hypothetical protein